MNILPIVSVNQNISKIKTNKPKSNPISFKSLKSPESDSAEVSSKRPSFFSYIKKVRQDRQAKFSPVLTIWGGGRELFKKYGIYGTFGFKHKNIDVLNWILHGLHNFSNITGGDFVKSIFWLEYEPLDKDTIACAGRIGLDYRAIYFNSDFFDNLDKEIDEILQKIKEDGNVLKYEDDKFASCDTFDTEATNEIVDLINDYISKKPLSFEDKMTLYESIVKISNINTRIANQPSIPLKQLGYNQNTLDEMSYEEQYDALVTEFSKGDIKIHIHKVDPFVTLYHEICHTRDIQRHIPVKCYEDSSDYPEILKNWFNNERDLNTAYSVSNYARKGGPQEFIAETYAKTIAGEKMSDEVKKLYRKYHGPRINIEF